MCQNPLLRCVLCVASVRIHQPSLKLLSLFFERSVQNSIPCITVLHRKVSTNGPMKIQHPESGICKILQLIAAAFSKSSIFACIHWFLHFFHHSCTSNWMYVATKYDVRIICRCPQSCQANPSPSPTSAIEAANFKEVGKHDAVHPDIFRRL